MKGAVISALAAHLVKSSAFALPAGSIGSGLNFPRAILPRGDEQSLKPRGGASFSVPLNFTGGWKLPLSLGGQEVQVVMDTGSSALWVVGSDVDSSTMQKDHIDEWYNPQESRTAKQIDGATFEVGYGDGTIVTGDVWTDEICFDDICVPDIPFGDAKQISGLKTSEDGFLGLAFPGLDPQANTKSFTLMDTLGPLLDQPTFTFNLAWHDGPSEVVFGSVDPSLYAGDVTTVGIHGPGSTLMDSWGSDNAQYQVDGVQATANLLYDTGSMFTTAPESVIRAYYAKVDQAFDIIGDATQWSIPCSTTPPDFEIKVGDATATVSGEKLMLDHIVNGHFTNDGSTSCIVALGKMGGSAATIGQAFFLDHVVTFNQQAPSVSWAKKA